MRHLLLVGAAALMLIACDHKSADEKLLDSVKPATSWSAALQLTAESWGRNSVPARFVKTAAEAGGKEIEKALRSVDDSDASRDLRKRLREQLTRERRAASELGTAAANDNRPDASRLAPQFAALHHELEALQK